MAVFIELVTTPISNMDGMNAGKTRVRRPLRGLEIKEDTYAYIKLMRLDGRAIDLVDSSSETGWSKEYSNFILQSVQEQRMERQQVMETFGDTYMFLFGESPRFLQVSAALINSYDFNWKAEFQYNYDNYLRGTRSLEKGARCYLFYDDNVVEGYIVNCSMSQDSQQPLMVQLQFQFYVTNYRNVSLIQTDGKYPIRSSIVVPEGVDLTATPDNTMLQQLTLQGTGTDDTLTANISRTRPIRSKISDNTDEYTTPLQPTVAETLRTAPNAQNSERGGGKSSYKQEAQDQMDRQLADGLSKAMNSYGVPRDAAYNPQAAKRMGVGPSFMPGGVGVGNGRSQAGARATFGAVAGAGYAGGFAGAGASVRGVASTGFGSFAGAYAGVGVGTSALGGAYAGSSYPSGRSGFGAGAYAGVGYGGTYGSSSPMSGGMSASERAYMQATGSIFGFGNSMGRGFGGQASYGYPNASAMSGYNGYAYGLMRSSARSGGYAGYGSYMGYPGYNTYMGASSAGQSGAGAGVYVGGVISAFSFTSMPGTLTNPTLPPAQAMSLYGPQYPLSSGWSWPSY